MTPRLLRWLEGAVVMLLVAALWWTLVTKQDVERQLVIERENTQAALDTVRAYRLGRQKDSVGYARSLLQLQVRLDGALGDLARAERLVAKLRADATIHVTPVDTTVVGNAPVVDSLGGALVGRLDLAGPPITGYVSARLAPATPSQWDVHLQVAPIPLRLTVGCKRDGPPAIGVVAPAWAQVELGESVLDPEVCHPKKGGAAGFLLKAGFFVLGWFAHDVTH